jgi:hypothetical protein
MPFVERVFPQQALSDRIPTFGTALSDAFSFREFLGSL